MGQFWRHLCCLSQQTEVDGKITDEPLAQASDILPDQESQFVEDTTTPDYLSLNDNVILFIDNDSSDTASVLHGTFGERQVSIKRIPNSMKQTALI